METADWKAGRTVSVAPDSAKTGLVHVHLSRIHAEVQWDVDYVGRYRASFSITPSTDGFRLAGTCEIARSGTSEVGTMPEQLIASLPGRRLSDLIDVPGAEEITISHVDISDGTLLLRFEPPGDDD